MIFKLHYWFLAAGCNALGILLGVFMEEYTDATSTEIGMLYMLNPFIGIVFRPLICSRADRKQSHRKYLMICQLLVAVTYLPFIVIPLMGPSLYDNHPRLCFYILVSLKVLGDTAFGGIVSIGDSLAINYARRIGTDFSVYRVWGTISWMVFGMITGQINEVWFLPKYVPAFMILISSALMSMFTIYLWPEEYFKMVVHSDQDERKSVTGCDNDKKRGHFQSDMKKTLLPNEVVWAHIKKKLSLLVTFRCMEANKKKTTKTANRYNVGPLDGGLNLTDQKKHTETISDQRAVERQLSSDQSNAQEVDMKTQLSILSLLIRRDARIVLYLMLFICAGFVVITLSFFFISLAKICHQDNRCDFSQLGGFIQVSMAIAETILFIYVKQIVDKLGRLNTVSLAFFVATLKFTFYSTIWESVDPYFSLIAESTHGLMFGIFLTLMVESAHLFANEVEYIIPELIQNNVISANANQEKLKLSLQATMQAIISNANDGLGRGFGALIYGIILDNYTYQVLWTCIAIGSATVFCIVQIVNWTDYFFQFNIGLDQKFKRQKIANLTIPENGNCKSDVSQHVVKLDQNNTDMRDQKDNESQVAA